jgi:hypothetical protein
MASPHRWFGTDLLKALTNLLKDQNTSDAPTKPESLKRIADF